LQRLPEAGYLCRAENAKMPFRGKQAGMRQMQNPLFQTADGFTDEERHAVCGAQDALPASYPGHPAPSCSTKDPSRHLMGYGSLPRSRASSERAHLLLLTRYAHRIGHETAGNRTDHSKNDNRGDSHGNRIHQCFFPGRFHENGDSLIEQIQAI